jgi:hypothetical protein
VWYCSPELLGFSWNLRQRKLQQAERNKLHEHPQGSPAQWPGIYFAATPFASNGTMLARSRHLGFIARAAEAAGKQADQWLFTLSDLMVLAMLYPGCEH